MHQVMRSVRAVLAVAVLLWCAGCGGLGGVPSPGGSSEGAAATTGKIAFVRGSSNGLASQVWVMNPNGTGQKQLTHLGKLNLGPSWSPDGRKIVFESTSTTLGDLYVMNADGTSAHRLFTPGGVGLRAWGPAWSPDGKKIAFVRSDALFHSFIYTINADGTHPTALTTGTGSDTSPTWSPDSKRLIFTSSRTGNPSLWVVNVGGTGLKQLISTGANEQEPDWSPNGKTVVFVRTAGMSMANLCLFTLATSKVSGLTNSVGFKLSPAWSPDGKQVAFEDTGSGGGDIRVVTVATHAVKRLTTSPFEDYEPAWWGQ